MTRLKAMDRLSDPKYGGNLNASQFYELMIEAGYSESVAQKAANQRGNSRMDAGVVQ